jgi:hypothetical protein
MPAENSLDFLAEVRIVLPQNGEVCEIAMTKTLLDSFKAGHVVSPATN